MSTPIDNINKDSEMETQNQLKTAEEAIAEMEPHANQNGQTFKKVDAWILTDNNFESADRILYVEPDLDVSSIQVVGDSVDGLYAHTEVGTPARSFLDPKGEGGTQTCGQCRYMGNGQCEAFLPPEDDIFQVYEVSASTQACKSFDPKEEVQP